MNVFSVRKGTYFMTLQQVGLLCITAYDGIPMQKGNPLCAVRRVGYYAFFLQQIARPRNTRIRFPVVLPDSNACRVCIRVITTNNIPLRMRGLAFPFEIFEKGVVSQIEMRGLAIME